MRILLAITVLGGGMAVGCAHPLEQIMDEHREARIHDAYAGQPLTHGAGDGLGSYIAVDAQSGLSVTAASGGKSGQ